MPDYFPADVSLRVTGEIGDAQKLFPVAKQLLARAIRLKESGLPLVRLFIPGKDGSLVHVRLHENLKHIYVQPGKLVGKEERKIVVQPEEVGVVYLMLSGLVRPGTFVEDAAHEFHPTQICADAYELEYAYQDMVKLGLESTTISGHVEARSPKPSMYTGAMKRVVQALYGLGKVGAPSFPEDLAGMGEIEVRNLYKCEYGITHGIIRDNKGIWLIEINFDRGVLKMALPVIEGTDADAYLDFIKQFDDTETAGIIEEFGGLPSGDTFPINDPEADPPNALDLAIAEGTVKRLLTPENLRPFYNDVGTGFSKSGLFATCGWAFSDTGKVLEAHNTCFWYKNFAFATILDTARSTYELLEAHPDYPTATVAPMEDRALTAEHWKISLASPEATLIQVEKSFFAGPQKTIFTLGYDGGGFPLNDFKDTEMLRVPSAAFSDSLTQLAIWGRPPSGYNMNFTGRGQSATYMNSDCPVLVFFRGDTLEVVRHQPERTYSGQFVMYNHPQNSYHAPGVGSFYNTDDVTHTFSVSGQSCTSSDYDPFTRFKSIPGYDIWSGTYAYRTSTSSFTVTATDPGHGNTFIACSGGPDGEHTEPIEDVTEYSAVLDELQQSEGEQPNNAPLYGSLQPQWGGVPFKLHYTSFSTHHAEAVEIGYGDNSSIGRVTVNVTTTVNSWTLIPGVQFAPDIEGFIYNKQSSVSGGSTPDGFHVTNISELSPNVWRRSGAFYSTFVDLRRNEEWSYLYIFGYPTGQYVIQAANWESKIGLTIPAFVREGYAFVRWDGGYQAKFSGGSLTGSDQLPEYRNTFLVAPGLSDGILVGNTFNVPQFEWDEIVNAFLYKYATTVNAGPTLCGILQSDIYADLVLPGVINKVLTPPQSFVGAAGGIPVNDCTSANSTYVGAV